MAINHTAIYTNCLTLKDFCSKDLTMQNALATIAKTTAEDGQTNAIAGDAASQTFISTYRRFVVNNDGVNRTIIINGFPYVFTAAKVYNPDPTETSFILQKAVENGYNITETNLAAYLAVGAGIVKAYTF